MYPEQDTQSVMSTAGQCLKPCNADWYEQGWAGFPPDDDLFEASQIPVQVLLE